MLRAAAGGLIDRFGRPLLAHTDNSEDPEEEAEPTPSPVSFTCEVQTWHETPERAFSAEMQRLIAGGYTFIDLDELNAAYDAAAVGQVILPPKSICITGDDSLKSQMTAWRIAQDLEVKGLNNPRRALPMQFFGIMKLDDILDDPKKTIDDVSDEVPAYFESPLRVHSYQTKAQLLEIARYLYNHTVNHPANLRVLSDDKLNWDIGEAQRRVGLIRKAAGCETDKKYFAYPVGVFDPRILAKVAAEGFNLAFTTNVFLQSKNRAAMSVHHPDLRLRAPRWGMS